MTIFGFTFFEALVLMWATGVVFYAARYTFLLKSYLRSLMKRYELSEELEQSVVENAATLIWGASIVSYFKWIALWFIPGLKPKVKLDFYDNEY